VLAILAKKGNLSVNSGSMILTSIVVVPARKRAAGLS
jgi:hypothetical protein